MPALAEEMEPRDGRVIVSPAMNQNERERPSLALHPAAAAQDPKSPKTRLKKLGARSLWNQAFVHRASPL